MIPNGAPLDDAWEKEGEAFMDAVEDGSLSFAEQLPIARRLVWELENQQRLPPGYWLRHECETRNCVNPAHAVLERVGS